MKNCDLPAMPIGEQIDTMHLNASCNGLTKREHFAAMAMVEMLRDYHEGARNDEFGYHADWAVELGKSAFEAADGLLAAGELERTK
jgi:hypothetical protein